MSEFIVKILDVCILPLQVTDNLLVIVPFVCLIVIALFNIIYRLMRVF